MKFIVLSLVCISAPLLCMEEKSLLWCNEELDSAFASLALEQGPLYVYIDRLTPGQKRYSYKNVDIKLSELLKDGKRYDNGKSILSVSKAVPVALGPDNLIVTIDGHHEIMGSLFNCNISIPVKIKYDYRQLSKDDFYQKLLQEGLIYPYDTDGNKYTFEEMTWHCMQNDPNRLFIALCCWRLKTSSTPLKEGKSRAEAGSYATKYPLWIKTEDQKDEVPFIEFKAGDILRREGFVYAEEKYGLAPDEDSVEKARTILRKNLQDPSIKGLHFIDLPYQWALITQNVAPTEY